MKQILYIGNKLEKHGASPTSVDTLPKLLKNEGFTFNAISSIKNKPLRFLHMLWYVIMNLRRRDLVLIDTYSTSNFWYAVTCGYFCKLFGIPYIFILHGGNLKARFKRSSEFILNIFRQAKACVVPSDFFREELKEFNFQNLKHIPNSIELSYYGFHERTYVKPHLLWVRAFDEVYRPELAIKVLESLQEKYPEAELCMVGPAKDDSFKRLKKLVKQKNLPVHFKGKLTKKRWTELSRKYDIFLNTTSVDNTPVSLLEAMALGLPVVSTNVGGIPYLIDDHDNGLLVEPDNPESMVSAIETLLTNPELAQKISKTGRARVEKYDWKKVKPLWIALLS
jgi:L-malate glycosyltransferase